ncbi:hypothetical protein ACH4FX_36215 [Streptomyces sp. NPDC018019]
MPDTSQQRRAAVGQLHALRAAVEAAVSGGPFVTSGAATAHITEFHRTR